MEQYIEYAKHLSANKEVLNWVETNLTNYIKKQESTNQTEVEHIIDYLVSDSAPKRLKKMSYEEAKKNTDKWNKALIKKGNDILEVGSDVEIIKDFGDGFKIVKLVGENAFKREGFLMRHCVASYFSGNTNIYSLRDKDNMPHCTMEENQQIKGKGNGSINPRYIKYVVAFLEEIGMTVGDNEMKNLGYVNVEDLKDEFNFGALYNDKYIYKEDIKRLENKDDVRLWSILDLFDFDSSMKVNFNFNITSSIKNFKSYLSSKANEKDDSKLVGGDNSKLVGGNNSTLTGGDYSTLVGEYYSIMTGGYDSKLAGGYNSTLAGGNDSKLAGGNYSKLAGGNYSIMAGGNYSKLAGGNYSIIASGYDSTIAGGNYSIIASGDDSKLAGGDNSIIVGDNESKAKGGIGSVITLVTRDSNRKIIDFKSAQIDGTTLKADTFYKLRDGVFVETE